MCRFIWKERTLNSECSWGFLVLESNFLENCFPRISIQKLMKLWPRGTRLHCKVAEELGDFFFVCVWYRFFRNKRYNIEGVVGVLCHRYPSQVVCGTVGVPATRPREAPVWHWVWTLNLQWRLQMFEIPEYCGLDTKESSKHVVEATQEEELCVHQKQGWKGRAT